MEYKNIMFNELSSEMLAQLSKGAFMTTRKENKVNTMTIGWGGINIVWNRPVFVAYVRYSRATYNMVDDTDEFTISVPLSQNLRKELGFCGTKSGRDYDKIADSNLSILEGRKVNVPILSDCELHYECKVIYKQAMEPSNIPNEIKEKFYDNNNYHVIFYGEILDSYLTEGVK